MKVAVFVGSLHKGSMNRKLAKNIEAALPTNVTFDYVDINLPLFNQDQETDFPTSAQRAKDIVEAADGVLFVTPEYNRSLPGVLKNAIDWASRPYGHNSFQNKPVAIAGATLNIVGTGAAQAELRNILSYLGGRILNQAELYMPNVTDGLFDENDMLTDERWKKNVQVFAEAIVAGFKQENMRG